MDILFNKEKIILLYIDIDLTINIDIINYIIESLNIKCVIILSNNDSFNFNNNEKLIEIIPDNKLEYNLLHKCEFIIYLSQYKKSNIIEDFLSTNYKLILHNIVNIKEEINFIKLDNNLLNYNNDKIVIDFLKFYKNLNKININESYNKNILININKVIENSNKITVVTVFKNSDNNFLKIIQLKCIIENLNNTNVSKILIIGNNLNELIRENLNNFTDKIIIYNKEDNITYKDILEIIHSKIENNNIIFLLMNDIIIPNQESLNNLNLEMGLLDMKKVYAISRLDRIFNGTVIKSSKLNKLFFSTEQDAWIFETPLILNETSMEKLSKIYFYDYLSNLYFNNEINNNNYVLINNSKKYKIYRFMLDNQINNRPLINYPNNSRDNNDIYILPSNDTVDDISVEQLIKIINLDENDIYSIKCYLFNKYLKNKIMNNI
jgi:hypothetical protein